MQRTFIKDLHDKVGEEVTIKGFVHTIRHQSKIKFILVRDKTGIIQCVAINGSDAFNSADDLTIESVIELSGLAKKEKQAPGGFEIEAKSIKILSKADPELPIPVVAEKGGEETNQPTRLDYRWIDLRKPEKLQIFKVWTELEKGFRKYFNENGFIQFYSPSFMNAPSESGAGVFEVDYFDRKAYLAQSPQFYKQMAMAAGFEKVFAVGPVFRAEPSFTPRHMTEFTGWDFEISYIDSHHDVMDEEEGLIVEGFKQLKETLLPDLEIPKRPFPRISMAEAKEKLAAHGVTSEKGHDISPEEERVISEIIKEEAGNDFLFITDYHISIRPFYHMRHEDNPEITKSFDLMYKGIEITTGAQREHRVDVLEKQAKEKGMNLDQLQNYINFFRYGCPPHGGVGIGPGRIIMRILDIPNIREATFLPRDVKRLTP